MSAMSDEALCVVGCCVAVGMGVAGVERLMVVAVWTMRMRVTVRLAMSLPVV